VIACQHQTVHIRSGGNLEIYPPLTASVHRIPGMSRCFLRNLQHAICEGIQNFDQHSREVNLMVRRYGMICYATGAKVMPALVTGFGTLPAQLQAAMDAFRRSQVPANIPIAVQWSAYIDFVFADHLSFSLSRASEKPMTMRFPKNPQPIIHPQLFGWSPHP